MRPLPFTELPDGIAFVVSVVVFAAVQVATSLGTFRGGSWWRRSDKGVDRGSLLVVMGTGGLSVAAAAVLSTKALWATIAAGDPVIRSIVFVAGLVLLLAGAALREWAVITLGASFTFDVRVAADQRVVTNGPYRFVRHPSYTGLVVSFVGLGLAFGNWLCVAILLVIPTAGLVYRIRVEESALRETLDDEYSRFASGRKRLIPGIW